MKQGVVMEIQTKDAFVFTNDCDLIKMPARKDMFVGQSVALPEPKVRSAAPRRWLIPVLAAACIVLLVSTGLLFSALLLPRAATAYLSLDINPSVEFELDAQRKVVAVTPLNADAWELLQETQIIGLYYEEAIVKWIDALRVNRPEQFEDLLISAVLDKRDRELVDQIMALNGQKAAEKLAALAGLNVRVLFSTDRAVKEQADANKLSIGRQMLLNLALEKKMGLSSDTIRKGSLSDLLNKLMPDETTETIAETTIQETSAETVAETTETAEVTETIPETTAAPTKETTHETTKATTKETTKFTTAPSLQPAPFNPVLQAVNDAEGFKLNWTISPDDRTLKYYKVVISKNDSTPQYSENGYLYALSKYENSCLANNSSKYNGTTDFGYYLTPGQQYFVAVTYVFADSKITSNVLQLAYNGPAAIVETTATAAGSSFDKVLTGGNDSAGLHLAWSQGPTDGSLAGYKVVISKGDSTPVYSENGYLTWITDLGVNSWVVDNSAVYNGTTDFGYYLTVNDWYYVSITYVMNNGEKLPSNVLHLRYTGPAAPAG